MTKNYKKPPKDTKLKGKPPFVPSKNNRYYMQNEIGLGENYYTVYDSKGINEKVVCGKKKAIVNDKEFAEKIVNLLNEEE